MITKYKFFKIINSYFKVMDKPFAGVGFRG